MTEIKLGQTFFNGKYAVVGLKDVVGHKTWKFHICLKSKRGAVKAGVVEEKNGKLSFLNVLPVGRSSSFYNFEGDTRA